MEINVAYREKSAWVSLLAILLTFGPYFAWVRINAPGDAVPNLPLLMMFGLTVAAQVVLMIIGHAVLAATSQGEAGAPADERDRAIERRAMTIAYYVLITGAILAGCVLPFVATGWVIVNAMIFAIVAAETVHYGVAVASYRREAA